MPYPSSTALNHPIRVFDHQIQQDPEKPRFTESWLARRKDDPLRGSCDGKNAWKKAQSLRTSCPWSYWTVVFASRLEWTRICRSSRNVTVKSTIDHSFCTQFPFSRVFSPCSVSLADADLSGLGVRCLKHLIGADFRLLLFIYQGMTFLLVKICSFPVNILDKLRREVQFTYE